MYRTALLLSALLGCELSVSPIVNSADSQLADAGQPDTIGVDAGDPITFNHRSIGVASGALYSVGTASVARGSVEVMLSVSADLPDKVGQGDALVIDNKRYFIAAHDGARRIRLQQPATESAEFASYRIERAYQRLGDWETDRQGDLVGDRRREIGVCYDDGPLTEAVTISGSTTNARYHFQLTVAQGQRHGGRAGPGVLLEPATATHAIEILDDYTQVAWLQITNWARGAASRSSFDGISVKADQVLIENVIIHDSGATVDNPDSNGITVEQNPGITVTVRNSLIYNLPRSGVSIHAAADATLRVLNCTIAGCVSNDNATTNYGCVCLYNSAGATIDARNVIAVASKGADFIAYEAGQFAATSSNNLSSDDTAPGPGSLFGITSSTLFSQHDLSGTDFDAHLREGASAIDNGSSLASDFSSDIDGDARPSGDGWDIGADER